MKARGWANPGSRSSCSFPTPTHTPSGSCRPEPPWQPAVEGSKRLGKGHPAATPRKPRPTLTSVHGLSGWLWCSTLMRIKIEGRTFITVVLRYQRTSQMSLGARMLQQPASTLQSTLTQWGTGSWRQIQKPDCGLERGPQRCGEIMRKELWAPSQQIWVFFAATEDL